VVVAASWLMDGEKAMECVARKRVLFPGKACGEGSGAALPESATRHRPPIRPFITSLAQPNPYPLSQLPLLYFVQKINPLISFIYMLLITTKLIIGL
jgi:hypothetical protein